MWVLGRLGCGPMLPALLGLQKHITSWPKPSKTEPKLPLCYMFSGFSLAVGVSLFQRSGPGIGPLISNRTGLSSFLSSGVLCLCCLLPCLHPSPCLHPVVDMFVFSYPRVFLLCLRFLLLCYWCLFLCQSDLFLCCPLFFLCSMVQMGRGEGHGLH